MSIFARSHSVRIGDTPTNMFDGIKKIASGVLQSHVGQVHLVIEVTPTNLICGLKMIVANIECFSNNTLSRVYDECSRSCSKRRDTILYQIFNL
jgi:hypothetical protein